MKTKGLIEKFKRLKKILNSNFYFLNPIKLMHPRKLIYPRKRNLIRVAFSKVTPIPVRKQTPVRKQIQVRKQMVIPVRKQILF